MLHISLQNITTCSYCRRYRQSTVYIRRVHTFTFTAYGFLLPEFTSFENVSDDFKIEIAEQFLQIKWKVLHSPKFVSLMMFFSSNFCPHLQQPLSNLSAKKLKSIILLPISITFLLVGWYFKNRHFTCLGFFLLKRPTWSRPSEAIFVPTEASKTFNDVTNRTSVYTYLPYTFFTGLYC